MTSRELLALGLIDLDEVLQFCGESSEWAAVVSLHISVNAAVTEDKARCGQHSGVGPELSAQRAVLLILLDILLQMERGRRCRQGSDGFNCALVFRGIPPLQELQEEDAQRQGGGEGDGHTLSCPRHEPPCSLHQSATTGTTA